MPPRLGALELKALVRRYGLPYSAALGIDVRSCRLAELSKWFLASMLYAKPIREETATRTYKIFEAEDRTTAQRIVGAGWEGLVGLLDAGGYVRYDFSTADRLLGVFGNLQAKYGGDLNRLHAAAKDSGDLERLLKGLGKGIGDVTVAILLRDLQGIWSKAKPRLTPLERLAMRKLGLSESALEATARRLRVNPVRLRTALARYGIRLRRGEGSPASSSRALPPGIPTLPAQPGRRAVIARHLLGTR